MQVRLLSHRNNLAAYDLCTQDVLVHRQLSAAIEFSPLHASLHSRHWVEQILDNVNRRHRMAQMASRASTEFYTGLALKAREKASGGRLPRESAFVIRTFRNGISVFVSAYVGYFPSASNLVR